jgi:hypothetical protein
MSKRQPDKLSIYWQMIVINPSGIGSGTMELFLPEAQRFLQSKYPHWLHQPTIADKEVYEELFQCCPNFGENSGSAAIAELCLRSFVSYPIRDACYDLAKRWLIGSSLSQQDLFPFVLNDDGCVPLRKYIPFSVEVLKVYQPRLGSSLREWTKRLVRQNYELTKFLEQHDISIRSDWAVLNRAKLSDLESEQDQVILSSYHKIYRQNWLRMRSQQRLGRCPEPSLSQLHEMSQELLKSNIYIDGEELMKELQSLAKYLRSRSLRGGKVLSLDTPYSGTEKIMEVEDIKSNLDVEDKEEEENQDFINDQFLACLDIGIDQALQNLISTVKRGRRAHLTNQVIPILDMVYAQGMSLNQVASTLNLEQYLLSRAIAPIKLVKSSHEQTTSQLIQVLLEKAKKQGWIEHSLHPSELDNIAQAVEAYLEAKTFKKARAELQAGKNREMNSIYAQRLRIILARYKNSYSS